ncbi:hypothetical protein LIER_40532 [Lithospermum erythrorhizon]|uniref:Uncharacterized protein n=1 Tax=Lithospermum erythrorhizon TaxID=34254 RepID=A0AAV3QZD2_LITER
METKRDLVKIGQEAFELLDKFYPPNRRSTSQTYFHQYQSPNPNMVVYKINPSSKVATSEKMTIIRTHEAEAVVESRGNPVVPRSQYQVLSQNNVHHPMKPATHATIVGNKADKKSRGGLFLIGGFGRK